MKEINKIEKFLISGSESLENILTLMEKEKEKFFIVVDAKKKLLGTISDADLRRELISSGLNASSNAQKIIKRCICINFCWRERGKNGRKVFKYTKDNY